MVPGNTKGPLFIPRSFKKLCRGEDVNANILEAQLGEKAYKLTTQEEQKQEELNTICHKIELTIAH